MDWEAINDRMCRLRIRDHFFNYQISNIPIRPYEETPDDEKKAFYAKLEEKFTAVRREI